MLINFVMEAIFGARKEEATEVCSENWEYLGRYMIGVLQAISSSNNKIPPTQEMQAVHFLHEKCDASW